MSFFRRNKAITHKQTHKQTQSKPSLQAFIFKANLTHVLEYQLKTALLTTGKRMSSFISLECKGSMTVEAALCVPIFMFAILSLISCIKIIDFQSHMDAALTETGNHMAVYAYNIDGYSTAYAKIKAEKYLGGEYIKDSLVSGGSFGIWYGESRILEDDDIINIKAQYYVEPIFNILGLSKIKLNNQFYGRAWTGYYLTENKKDGEGIVYITEYGEVFHKNRQCSHLTLSVERISYALLENYRNESGSRYRACDYCTKEELGEAVYIAEDGDSFHTTMDCKGLKRTVYAVKQSEAGNRSACTRCGFGE